MTLSITITKKHTLAITGALIGLFSLSLVTISSAHGGNTNLIHGCVLNTLGTLRIVSAGTACGVGETATHWNQEGAPGLGGFVDDLTYANLSNSDFRYRNLGGKDFGNANLTQALMDRASVANADFSDAVFQGVNLSSVTGFSSAILGGTDFTSATLDELDFSGRDLRTNYFAQANIRYANLTGVNLSDTDLSYVSFNGSNLTNANLDGATGIGDISGVTWNNTTCPDGTNSDNNNDTCEDHLTP